MSLFARIVSIRSRAALPLAMVSSNQPTRKYLRVTGAGKVSLQSRM
jgi:hypothetical protein